MSEFAVSLSGEVSFAPRNEVEEILQNVRTILNTRIGSVPLDREFGISWEHLDKPVQVAKTRMMVDVIDAIEKHEPRAKVREVKFEDSDAVEGVLKPVVIVSIGEENEEE